MLRATKCLVRVENNIMPKHKNDILAIVLAAGRGTRMKSETAKVMHKILGRPMISYVLDALAAAGIAETVVVAGYGADQLEGSVGSAKVVIQKELLGSGDAVSVAKKALGKHSGDILVICGDTPLIQGSTITSLIEKHKSSGASATVLTVELKDPTGYGRILRGASGKVVKIVEEEKAPLYEKVIEEINAGTYCFKSEDLFAALEQVKPDNKKQELFLTDTVEIMAKEGKPVEALKIDDIEETIGINTRKDLAEAIRIMKIRIMNEIMAGGVTIEDPASTTIYPEVEIGKDTIIHPNTIIESDVVIGENCSIGPFTRIRPHVRIGSGVEVGNFVELVRTEVGDRSKVKHHTYLGDTKVGKNVNIGAGTITANYDGKNKNATVIGDGSFLGIGTRLIAPVKVGKNCVLGAGCVVLKDHDVPDNSTVVGVPARIIKGKGKKG